MMRPPAFWSRPPGLAAGLLRPAAALYGGVAGRRMAEPGARAPVPVICVGNFTTGGTGKTPAALALVERLRALGRRPGCLTRGYGGRLPGPVRVDPGRHTAADIGDEALLLARAAPTVVARDRVAGAALCAAEGADVIVMDDGLQNPSLAKDLAFALVDAEAGLGNGLCLPAGPLRAPMAAQWPRVDAVVVVGEGRGAEAPAAEAGRRGLPVLGAALRPEPETCARLAGQGILAFAGIGRPEKFFATLAACGADPVRRRAFPDHHPYGIAEIAALVAEAREAGLLPVTTEKDLARIGGMPEARGILALPARLVFEDAVALDGLLRRALAGGEARR